MKLRDSDKQAELERLSRRLDELEKVVSVKITEREKLIDDIKKNKDKIDELEKLRKELESSSVKKYDLEEMGHWYGEKMPWLELKGDFMNESGIHNGKVACPFCDTGVLKLSKKEENICKTHGVVTSVKHEFKCSENCREKQGKYVLISYRRDVWNC